MEFDYLYQGILKKRYKRFLSEIELENGEIVTAYCANTGSMLQCANSGSEVLVSKSNNKNRKLKYTWQFIKINNSWVCINTTLSNNLVFDFITSKENPLFAYQNILRERPYGTRKSRIDILLEDRQNYSYIEVKNVTLTDGEKKALFPDSITKRGQKHLLELIDIKKTGQRAIVIFTVQRPEVKEFSIAKSIDKEYADLFLKAKECGVEFYALKTLFNIETRKLLLTNEEVLIVDP